MSKRTEKAVACYRGEAGQRRLNCAEAVAEAVKDLYPLPDGVRDGLRASSAGRAPGGVCGAYHAAMLLVAGQEGQAAREELTRGFLSAAGSLQCREIRALKRLSCAGCVEKAVAFLEGGEKS